MERKDQSQARRHELHDRLWLLYYNQYLYDHGVITERERNRMKNKINAQAHSR